MDYEIRNIRPGEASELKRLACPNFSVVEQLFMPKPRMGVVALERDGSIAGSAFLVVVKAGGKAIGCVDIVFVLPQYRGSGVAKQLYHAAVESLHQQGCETVMALVRGDNTPSLHCFEAEGLHPVSLGMLNRRIGFSATARLFVKTASLACATGCWILCENVRAQPAQESTKNLVRMFAVNGGLLLGGAALGAIFQKSAGSWWNFLAALLFLAVITLGESLGRKNAKGAWHFVLPEGGLVPTAIVAMLGGFYPLLGHWYPAQRENSGTYRRRTAAPAKGAWLALMTATAVCGILNRMHPLFSCGTDIGIMLLIFYMLPFYPFDTFGGRRVREDRFLSYIGFTAFSLLVLVIVSFYRVPQSLLY